MLLNETKTYSYKINLLLNDISIYEKMNDRKIITKTQKVNSAIRKLIRNENKSLYKNHPRAENTQTLWSS